MRRLLAYTTWHLINVQTIVTIEVFAARLEDVAAMLVTAAQAAKPFVPTPAVVRAVVSKVAVCASRVSVAQIARCKVVAMAMGAARCLAPVSVKLAGEVLNVRWSCYVAIPPVHSMAFA